ncbi:hypothetical protein TNCV_3909471 [Trichonephila clavipes]|nr:hypothetical protein TNCV_3909471 [Trichonephila clavipes]
MASSTLRQRFQPGWLKFHPSPLTLVNFRLGLGPQKVHLIFHPVCRFYLLDKITPFIEGQGFTLVKVGERGTGGQLLVDIRLWCCSRWTSG